MAFTTRVSTPRWGRASAIAPVEVLAMSVDAIKPDFNDGVSAEMKPLFSKSAAHSFVPSSRWANAADQLKAPASNYSVLDTPWNTWAPQTFGGCAVNLDDYTDDSDVEDAFEGNAKTRCNMTMKLSPATQSPALTSSDSCEPDGEPDCEPLTLPKSEESMLPAAAAASLDARQLLRWRAATTLDDPTLVKHLPVARATDLKRKPELTWRDRLGATDLKANNLEVSANSWAARQRARRNGGVTSGTNDSNEMSGAVKSILNKLTIEKFPQLCEQLIDLGFKSQDHVKTLIKEIFDKATSQHHFIDMYADLCVLLHKRLSKSSIKLDPEFSFRKLLLKEVQSSFAQYQEPPADLDLLVEEERTLAGVRYKTRMLGNVRLLGALLVRGIVASRVFVTILVEFLGNTGSESLESVATLLTCAGATFDKPEWAHHAALVTIFEQVEDIVGQNSSCTPRVRYLLKDVLELRAGGWQERRPKRLEAPTTLEEQARRQIASDSRGYWRPARQQLLVDASEGVNASEGVDAILPRGVDAPERGGRVAEMHWMKLLAMRSALALACLSWMALVEYSFGLAENRFLVIDRAD